MGFLELRRCPHCGTCGLPTNDGLCPNCWHSVADAPAVRLEISDGTSPEEREQILDEISAGGLAQKEQQVAKHDMKCPICGLINLPGTITCDCGYDFTLRRSVGWWPGMAVAGQYIGLTMVLLGVLGLSLLPGLYRGFWFIVGASGGLSVCLTRSAAKRFMAADPHDLIKPLHVLAVVTICASIPWGIVNLTCGKKRSGWFLIVGCFVMIGLLIVAATLVKSWIDLIESRFR